MPITNAAKKDLRQTKKRRARNTSRRRTMQEAVKAALAAPEAEQDKALTRAYKAIDKAAKAGVIKQNTAARKKSRLTKAVNQKQAASTA